MRTAFALAHTAAEISEFYGAATSRTSGWGPSYHFAANRKIVVVRQRLEHGLRTLTLETASWGLSPEWNTGELKPVYAIGVDRVGNNGLFAAALARQRCLVPLNGFYAWQRSGAVAEPRYVHGTEPILSAMGVFTTRVVNGRAILTVALLTGERPGAQSREWPSVLTPADARLWLNGAVDTAVDLPLVEFQARSAALAEGLLSYRIGDGINAVVPRDSARLVRLLGS
ncbi:SOS response-associated peptidase family protein [Subtercola sp. RTI3]|uniref:SOS response-associated peptidase family protein n=1 Tax=Subtercola sp. RTI3 TaxID=3048639 RepID=UPI002B226CC2|nr:SOS response-associated peptidase family protein [Subtercola sp. RTI3]MEA9985084.1 SOS response-associated peptidase family protein [Subtercola sp. RTI3]